MSKRSACGDTPGGVGKLAKLSADAMQTLAGPGPCFPESSSRQPDENALVGESSAEDSWGPWSAHGGKSWLATIVPQTPKTPPMHSEHSATDREESFWWTHQDGDRDGWQERRRWHCGGWNEHFGFHDKDDWGHEEHDKQDNIAAWKCDWNGDDADWNHHWSFGWEGQRTWKHIWSDDWQEADACEQGSGEKSGSQAVNSALSHSDDDPEDKHQLGKQNWLDEVEAASKELELEAMRVSHEAHKD